MEILGESSFQSRQQKKSMQILATKILIEQVWNSIRRRYCDEDLLGYLLVRDVLNESSKAALKIQQVKVLLASISKIQLFYIRLCIYRLSFIIRKIQKMTSNIFVQTFARFKHTQTISEIAQTCRKQLNINIYQSINLKVGDILHKFQHLEKKYSKPIRTENGLQWKEDEKKVFLCFLLAYCHLLLKKISEITQNQWEQISHAFHNKNILFMRYEAKAVDKHCERVHWEIEQEQMLCHCITSQMNGKWANISRYIFFESKGQTFKTPKQCRQHWFNHMNRALKRGDWQVEQDLAILYSVLDYGHKWARIVELLLGKRTEHMIKNRFHSLLTCSSKMNQDKRQKNQTKLIKTIINELTLAKKQTKTKNQIKPNNYKLNQQIQSIKSQYFQPQSICQPLNCIRNSQCLQEQQVPRNILNEDQNKVTFKNQSNLNGNIEYLTPNFQHLNTINTINLIQNPYCFTMIYGNSLQPYSSTFFLLPIFTNIDTPYQQQY